MDYEKMTGFEFEDFIANLLRKKGFTVTQTSYSGDGGIDMIAEYHSPLFFGKYVVQCKNYSGLVGQPELRDLYGVVMAESANKGILITPSDFTEQAYEFARGKQLELINGKGLQRLVMEEPFLQQRPNDMKPSFLSNEGFNISRYKYLKLRIEEDPKEEQNYRDLYDLLYGWLYRCLTEKKYNQCDTVFFQEILSLIRTWKNRCYRGKSKEVERTMCDLIESNILMICGEVAQAVECLIRCGEAYLIFSEYEEFWPYIVEMRYDTIKHLKEDLETTVYRRRHIHALNAYVAFRNVGFDRGINYITKKLKHISAAEDYYTVGEEFHGISHSEVHGIGNYSYTTDGIRSFKQLPNDVQLELKRFFIWYQNFRNGGLDNSYLLANSFCKKEGGKKHIVTWIKNYKEAACSYLEIKAVYCGKSNEEICRELNDVFNNHGI